MHFTVVTVVAYVTAFALSAHRILSSSKPFWSLMPPWLQGVLPGLVIALPALVQGLTGALTWTDVIVASITAAALVFPGLHSHIVEFKKPNGPGSAGMGAAVLLLIGVGLASATTGCAAFAAAVPVIAEVGSIIADAVNDLDYIEQIVASFPGLSSSQRATIETKLQAARLALQAAAAADSGAKDLTAEQLDASLAAFRTAWGDLNQALEEAGIVSGAKIGATAGTINIPQPIALKRVSK
jgi:hypothetical protein